MGDFMRVKTFTKSINEEYPVSDLAGLDSDINSFMEKTDVIKTIPHLISSGSNLVYMVTIIYKV